MREVVGVPVLLITPAKVGVVVVVPVVRVCAPNLTNVPEAPFKSPIVAPELVPEMSKADVLFKVMAPVEASEPDPESAIVAELFPIVPPE